MMRLLRLWRAMHRDAMLILGALRQADRLVVAAAGGAADPVLRPRSAQPDAADAGSCR